MNSKRLSHKRYDREFLLSLSVKGQIPKNYTQIEEIFKKKPNANFDQKDVENLILNKRNNRTDDLLKYLSDKLNAKDINLNDIQTSLLNVTNKAEEMAIELLKLTSSMNDVMNKFFKIDTDFQMEVLNNAATHLNDTKLKNQFIPKIRVKKCLISDENNKISLETKIQKKEKLSQIECLKSIRNRLKNLLQDAKDSNDFVQDAILTEFSSLELKSKDFVGTLALMLCKRCFDNDLFDASLFAKRIPLLEKFLDSNETLFMEALKAVRALDDVKHPKGFLSEVFSLLYDFGVMNKEVFFRWKDKNQKYQNSLFSLNDFFSYLNSS